jgi:hypothetical protein
MNTTEQQMTEKESLALIAQMIGRAKNAYHDTGVSAMMWGAVIAVCALVKCAELHFDFRLPFDIFLLTFAAIIPQIIIGMREKKMRRARTYEDITMGYVWWTFGISIFLLSLITNIMFPGMQRLAADYRQLSGNAPAFKLSEYTSSLFLLLYGMPTFITGGIMKFKPMLLGGILCWVCCVAALFTPVKIDLLLTASAAFCAWFIPGVIMQKDHLRAKKSLGQQHV